MDGAAEPIIAIIGHPIAGNPTQFALETGFQAAQLDCRVLSVDLPAEKVPLAVAGMDAMNFRGIWVTPSCKDAAFSVVSKELPMLLDFLRHAPHPDSDAPWTAFSLKEQVWPELAAESLQRRSHGCRRLWWIDDQADLSDENLLVKKNKILGQVQATDRAVFSAITADHIEIISDVAGIAQGDFSEEQDDLIVWARSNLQDLPPQWLPPSQCITIDLNEDWDPAYLADWDRIKADADGVCLRGADVHAACLSKLTKLLFDHQINSEVFQEAIDEYLAV